VFLCVSLNAAIDKRVRLRRLNRGHVNRAMEATQAPGGKTAHVAMVLRTLGADPFWMGFAGGPTGSALVAGLKALSIRVEAVPTASATQMNVEILENEGEVTEILEPGGAISAEELETLRDALKAQPDFVKPNQEEAEWLSGHAIDGRRSAGNVLKMIIGKGASAGAISLGARGSLWQRAKEGEVLFAKAPEMTGRSTVGSGDSTLAGFAFPEHQGLEAAESLCLAAACGAANCLAGEPERARADDITRLKKEIHAEIVQELAKG
jgi:fructose-1-phosphate kinase PfkB-like protein